MLKQLITGIAVFLVTIGFAFAQVDANKADQAALDGIKGIGPITSKAILDERKRGGDFRDWTDFENRVKGIGAKSAAKLSQAGLTINSQPKSNIPTTVSKDLKKVVKTEAKAAKESGKDAKKSVNIDAENIKQDVKKEELTK